MKKQQAKVRKVKAWGTIIPDWKGGSLGDIFFYKDEAFAKAKINVLHKKVIPVIITFTLPTKKPKK